MSTNETKESLNFIENIVEEHNRTGRFAQRVWTRFPPEPNGYLHIGHAKSICLNFGLAQKYGGKTNLRFDDTNPVTEDTEYVDSIMADVRWLGFEWHGEPLYASDYFDQLYTWAQELIRAGKAYVDDSATEEIRRMRGVPTSPGEESPYRNRSVAENLDLFERMKNGEFDEGTKVLRAKVDMASPNMHLRDPIMYRILKRHHHRTGDKWCIYPMYDWAHGQSDSIEEITHSICTLEFEVHRPLYDWFVKELGIYAPQQIEFARLNLSYTVMSKRKLLELVRDGHVNGWDDPRMPTISGMRRRGYTPASLRNFAERIGIARRENVIDVALLEFSVREDLNQHAARVMAVLDPIKVIITNYPEGQVEEMEIENNPEDPQSGNRMVPFSRELWIEQGDFMENPPLPKKYFRLGPGRTVRLKGAYIITCDDFVKDPETGKITALHCSYYPDSRSGSDTSGIKAKGTLHWVSIPHALEAEIRLYDRLFVDEDPAGHKDRDFKEFLNPDSLQSITGYVEPALRDAQALAHFQFIRMGYFSVDPDSAPDSLIFNRTATLRDNWTKVMEKS